MKIKKLAILMLAALVVFLLAGMARQYRGGCWTGLADWGGISTGAARAAAAERASRAGHAPIEIGVIGSWSQAGLPLTNLLRGIELAARLINERKGLGRPLQLHVRDFGGQVAQAKQHMQEFCENPDISAVLGGMAYGDFMALWPLAEFNELLFISPSLAPDRDRLGAAPRFCFFTYPPSAAGLAAIRAFMRQEALKAVAILSPADLYYGHYFCNAFDRAMPRDTFGQAGVMDRVVYTRPLNPAFIEQTFRFWQGIISYDTLLLSGDAQAAALVCDAARQMEDPPAIILTEETTHHQLAALAIPDNLQVHLLSAYDPRDPKPANTEFIACYREAYGAAPDWLAAQGYDTLNVLAAAMAAASSAVPARVAAALRDLKYTQNVSAAPRITFDEFGTPRDGKMILIRGVSP